MIRTKADLARYLEEDRIWLNKNRKRPRFFGDEIWNFQILLRKEEFHHNNNNKIRALWYKVIRHRIGLKLGFTIPINVFGPGLSIAHYGTIIVNKNCKIGAYCRIHAGVNIGTKAGESGKAATIGDYAYIGPGAKIYGPITLGNYVAVGANAVVNRDFSLDSCTLAGVPARKIADKGSNGLWLKDSEVSKLRAINSR